MYNFNLQVFLGTTMNGCSFVSSIKSIKANKKLKLKILIFNNIYIH